MKIFLIACSSESSLNSMAPDKFKELSVGHYPPLGLMYLASYLHEKTGHKAEILDIEVEPLTPDAAADRAIASGADAVGFYTTSFNVHIVYRLLRSLRARGFKGTVILGGPHIELYPEETVSLPGVDIAVVGEGEETLAELLDCLQGKGGLAAVKGILYKENGAPRRTPDRPLLMDLDSLPMPARRLTKYGRYYNVAGMEAVSTTLMTSRGCPFRCNFCFVQYGGCYRFRSAASVVREIEDCVSLGIREFFFFDEIFTADKKRAAAICDAIVEKKLDISFTIRSRVDTMDAPLLAKLKAAGCERVQYGVESGTDEILAAMNKRITVAQVRETVRITKEAGLEMLLDFMIGYPGETEEQIRRSVAFARELDPDFAIFGVTTFYPGIKIYKEALAAGRIDDFWRGVAAAPPERLTPPFASDRFTRPQLERMLRRAYLSFYSRPSYMLRRLSKISSPRALLRQAKAGWDLLRGN
jgi:radical SAM superfamily enzyme YgiQ (UPF0313 family)